MLHIVNGDVSASLIREAGVRGAMLPWRDSLHEGPLSATASLAELAERRAAFVAACGWQDGPSALRNFSSRNEALAQFGDEPEVVLWFDGDYYSQLQRLQLLDWFSRQEMGATRLSEVDLGQRLEWHSAGELLLLFRRRLPVVPSKLAAGAQAWQAYAGASPQSLLEVIRSANPALPELRTVLLRQLEQLPALGNGLSRTEAHALRLVHAGIEQPADLFVAVQATEDSDYMGDWAFWRHLAGLFNPAAPLLATADGAAFRYPPRHPHDAQFLAQRLALTALGEEVLAGRCDWLDHGVIDRHVGGVHLTRGVRLWRWDGARADVSQDAHVHGRGRAADAGNVAA